MSGNGECWGRPKTTNSPFQKIQGKQRRAIFNMCIIYWCVVLPLPTVSVSMDLS